MPKSKTRGSLKEHKKRVTDRNTTLRGNKRKMESLYKKMMTDAYEKFLTENPQISSGNTETEDVEIESTNINDINVDYTPVNPENTIEQ
jgi:hypothetical protein